MGSKPPRTTPAVMKYKYQRRLMREKKSDAAHTLLYLSDQFSEPFVYQEPISNTREIGCQIDIQCCDITNMILELQHLRTVNIQLKENVKNMSQFNEEGFEGNDYKVKKFTDLTCFMTMRSLFRYLEPYLPVKHSIGKFQCFMLLLIKLRLNFTVSCSAFQLGVSKATVSRVFIDSINVMYARMKLFILWPDRESLWKTMPVQFQESFGKMCRNN